MMDDLTMREKLLELRDSTIEALVQRIKSGKAKASDIANVIRLLRYSGLGKNEEKEEEEKNRRPDDDNYDFSDAPFPSPPSADGAGGIQSDSTPASEKEGPQEDEQIPQVFDPAILEEMPFK